MVPVERAVSLTCALVLIGAGLYFLFSILLTGVQHGGLRGRLVIVAAGMTVFGAYWLWVAFIKVTPKG